VKERRETRGQWSGIQQLRGKQLLTTSLWNFQISIQKAVRTIHPLKKKDGANMVWGTSHQDDIQWRSQEFYRV